MATADTSFAIEFMLALSAILNAVVIFPVYRKLNAKEKVNMASFSLKPSETLLDFRLINAAVVAFLVSTSVYILGDLFQVSPAVSLGNVMSSLSSFIPLYVFYRWWRRFR